MSCGEGREGDGRMRTGDVGSGRAMSGADGRLRGGSRTEALVDPSLKRGGRGNARAVSWALARGGRGNARAASWAGVVGDHAVTHGRVAWEGNPQAVD